jgi:hypothetical protein
MSESITIVDPVTGLPVLAQATLANCFMLLATQIFAYTIPREGQQHTPPLQNVLVDEALSHAIGFNLFTNARTGQILAVEALGVGQDAAVSKIT